MQLQVHSCSCTTIDRLFLATGDGETLMKYCPSFQVVELMRQGYSPCDACERVLKNIVNREKKMFEAGLIALNIKVIYLVIECSRYFDFALGLYWC